MSSEAVEALLSPSRIPAAGATEAAETGASGSTAAAGPDGRSGPGTVVQRAQDGDIRAFEQLYRENSGRVYALCLRLLGDPHAAEEAAQEAFIRAWSRLGSFGGRSAFSTWMHRLTVNVVLDRRRAQKRRALDLRAGDDEALEGLPTAPARRPDHAIDLERALETLPERARLAFVLHDIEGYRHREIAEMTGTAEGTWKAQLHRARRLLREALNR
ncbi:MAG: RNA polymerase sigma factor [Gemmatimonadetes bacterium]|nr:RNA polymerase sigma factor [Gemmatimonadota bacterium]